MQIENITDRFLKKGSGDLFYTFSNADGKVWLMPARNMRTAMNLYQPSGRNGILMKKLFPMLHHISAVRRKVKAEKRYCDLKEDFQELLSKLFGEKELEFSVFFGTPCVHQKITMQISEGKRILGYCKLTDNREIARLFESEAKILKRLEEQKLDGMPRCLFCGEIEKGAHLFVQSTSKTQNSIVPHEWCELHDSFLRNLRNKTQRTVLFEESDYYQTVKELEEHLDWLPEFVDRGVVRNAIEGILDKYQRKEVDFSAYHADFTPWNMFVEKGSLFVFDWEYARMTYPPMLDRYHFFMQTAIFEKHWVAKEIIEYIRSTEADWVDKESFILYLLDIVSRFTVRERGNVDGDIARSMRIWNDLLVFFVNETYSLFSPV